MLATAIIVLQHALEIISTYLGADFIDVVTC